MAKPIVDYRAGDRVVLKDGSRPGWWQVDTLQIAPGEARVWLLGGLAAADATLFRKATEDEEGEEMRAMGSVRHVLNTTIVPQAPETMMVCIWVGGRIPVDRVCAVSKEFTDADCEALIKKELMHNDQAAEIEDPWGWSQTTRKEQWWLGSEPGLKPKVQPVRTSPDITRTTGMAGHQYGRSHETIRDVPNQTFRREPVPEARRPVGDWPELVTPVPILEAIKGGVFIQESMGVRMTQTPLRAADSMAEDRVVTTDDPGSGLYPRQSRAPAKPRCLTCNDTGVIRERRGNMTESVTPCPQCGPKEDTKEMPIPRRPRDTLGAAPDDFDYLDYSQLLAAGVGEPRVHGNGFIQLDLEWGERLNYWGHPGIPRQIMSSQIHNHRFGFVSFVLLGALVNQHWTVIENQVEWQPTHDAFKPQVREGEDTELIRVASVYAAPAHTRMQHVQTGGHYRMRAGQYHETFVNQPTITRMVKQEITEEPVRVLLPLGVKPDNRFIRHEVMPARDVMNIIREMCERGQLMREIANAR